MTRYTYWKIIHHLDNPSGYEYAALRYDERGWPHPVGKTWYVNVQDAIGAVGKDRAEVLASGYVKEMYPVEFTHR